MDARARARVRTAQLGELLHVSVRQMAGRKKDRSRLRSSPRRRPMESTLFVGLDAHKSSIVATVVDREGKKLDQTKLGSGDAELGQYLGGAR